VLSSCSSTTSSSAGGRPPAFGTITGIASMCSGPAGLLPHDVTVRILQGNRLVAKQTHLGNVPYRLSVPPGHYTVTSDQSYAGPVSVTVHPGEVVQAQVYSSCS
jgi:hypothetical protein